MIATIGIRDSGTAVATAARTLPTAPWPRFSMLPNHSIAFVKRSAPASRIAKLAGRRTAELTNGHKFFVVRVDRHSELTVAATRLLRDFRVPDPRRGDGWQRQPIGRRTTCS